MFNFLNHSKYFNFDDNIYILPVGRNHHLQNIFFFDKYKIILILEDINRKSL